MAYPNIQRVNQGNANSVAFLANGATSTSGTVPVTCVNAARLIATANCYVSFTANASTVNASNGTLIPTSQAGGELFRVAIGEVINVSAASGAAGILNISWLT